MILINVELLKYFLKNWISLLNTDGINSKKLVKEQIEEYLKSLQEESNNE